MSIPAEESSPMMDAFYQELKASRYIRRPLRTDAAFGAEKQWSRKKLLEDQDMNLMENYDKLLHIGPGVMHPCPEFSHSGKGSVRLDMPTSTAIKNSGNRRYAYSGFVYPFRHENLEHFNRLTIWVYVDAPGLIFDSIMVDLENDGDHIMPVPGRFEGSHHADMRTGEWTQILWEFPDQYRDQVTGFRFYCSLHGSPMNATETKTLYFDDFRLSTVEKPEKSRGFDLKEDGIAYCHSGYLPEARKQAVVQRIQADRFQLLKDGKPIYEGKPIACAQGFSVLDFTEFKTPGWYTLSVGSLSTRPFLIGEHAFESAAWKALSFFFTERCGFEVPGVHIECHLDACTRHPDGRTVAIHGGWHDAADLSQSIDKTCDVILAMLDLADATRERDPDFSQRVLEEARWGLNWAMRTRFGDGYRHVFCVKGIWSDNLKGTKDDMVGQADNTAIHNYAAAYVCAYAVPFFREPEDEAFKAWCLRCAEEDFAFGEATLESSQDRSLMVERIALATAVAAMLYRVTGKEKYLKDAALRARQLAQCQQLERRTDFSIPLHGFFYETRERLRPVAFYHRSMEHYLTMGFALLLQDAPDHPDAGLWKQCAEAYADYLKDTADVMAPYGILPAGVYELDNTDWSMMAHEGSRDIGAPSMEEYDAQVKNGIQLNDRFYLRRFPVAYQFRGFHTTLLSKAKNAFTLARLLKDRELYDIGVRQLEYVLGMNPFAMSTMYGEGYDYPPLYTGFSGIPVGAVPVGFETFENDDEPYMPMQNNCTYKEVWVCSTARVMWSIAETWKGF